jgi:putative transposase
VFQVAKMCDLFGVSTSGFYDWVKREPSEQEMKREQLAVDIKRVHSKSREIYGSPKITEQLHKEGIGVSERTVQRIMKKEGVVSKTTKKFKTTTNSKHDNPVYPNLLEQKFTMDAPGKAWVADITYVWTKEGYLYLASVMDLYSRKIIGFHMGDRLKKELVITALERAMKHQPPQKGLIHHSDRGSQYASLEYTNELKESKIQISMSRKGNCYDNACIESFHSVIKKELIYQTTYTTRAEAKRDIFEYITCFYNPERIHSTNGYLSPMEFEKAYFQKKRTA